MVCGHTTYVLCTPFINDCVDVSNLSIANSIADLTPKKGRSIGVMVIKTSLEMKHAKK